MPNTLEHKSIEHKSVETDFSYEITDMMKRLIERSSYRADTHHVASIFNYRKDRKI